MVGFVFRFFIIPKTPNGTYMWSFGVVSSNTISGRLPTEFRYETNVFNVFMKDGSKICAFLKNAAR